MPPKKATTSTPAANGPVDPIDEDPLQAVVLADSFNRRFEVLCVDKPRCLLPLLGTPLLAWTLESLSLSNVKEVFIFCGAHAQAIQDWVEASPYARAFTSIQCVTSQNAISPGDALRQLDAMQVLNPKTPFLLLHSPIVSSLDLGRVVRRHRQMREADKNLIMTLAVGTGGRKHPESPLMLVNPDASVLLHYAQHPAIPAPSRFAFPSKLILESSDPRGLSLEVWGGNGTRDLGIDVCEADVPALFTENFDWQDMRRHLVCGVLQSFELLQKRIGVFKIEQRAGGPAGEGEDAQAQQPTAERTYVERVRDTRTFSDISRDILRRWAYPLVPDYLGVLGGDDYELRRGGIYIAKENVVLARTTTLYGPLLLGPQTHLAQNTSVRQSVLGRANRIGANTSITDAYLFDNVTVGRGCVLEGCIIGEGVVLEDGVRIGKGALVGGGVKVGARQTIGEFARIGRTARAPDAFDEDDEDEGAEDANEGVEKLPGETSVGYIWPNEEVDMDSDEELDDPYEHPENRQLSRYGRDMDEVSLASSSMSTLSHASTSAPPTPLSSASSKSEDLNIPDMSLGVPSSPEFAVEARLSLDRAAREKHKIDDALLELKTLMLSSNVGVSGPGGAREVVVAWLMDLIEVGADARAAKARADGVLERWGGIPEGIGAVGAGLCMEVQRYCLTHPDHARIFPILLNSIYSADLAEQEDVVIWCKDPAARGIGIANADVAAQWKALWDQGYRFVKALAAAAASEEESEGESEEESDDGSD